MDRNLLEAAIKDWDSLNTLRNLLLNQVAQGKDRETLTQELTEFALELRAANRESDEELILEVLDFLTGWCSPSMKKYSAPSIHFF